MDARQRERLLVVVARNYEADAVLRHAADRSTGRLGKSDLLTGRHGQSSVVVVVADVGPINAALGAINVLHHDAAFDAVVSAGIAGAFPDVGVSVGSLVVGAQLHHGDFGAEVAAGFEPGAQRDWPNSSLTCDPALSARFAECDGLTADILTVTRQSTSPTRISELRRSWPDAAAEAMEGIGVAATAALFSVPMVEVRAISNIVGPRDQYPWDKPAALDTLADTFRAFGRS